MAHAYIWQKKIDPNEGLSFYIFYRTAKVRKVNGQKNRWLELKSNRK